MNRITYLAINHSEAGKLFKEWTKKEPDFDNYILLNSFFFGAYKDDRIVGVAQLIIIDDPFWNRRWGLIENVFVKKEYRRQGIGKGLMKQLENQAISLGCSFVKLTSRKEEGIELYRSIGYEEGSSFRKEL